MEITWRDISEEENGGNGGQGTGNQKHKWQVQNKQGEVKNIMGNGETKELICPTHGPELKWGDAGGRGGTGWMGIKGRKKWDNCNSIINKIILKIGKQYKLQVVIILLQVERDFNS